MSKKDDSAIAVAQESPFLLYSGDDEQVHVRVLIHAETLWLPQRLMAELFQTSTDNISLHLKNIFAEGELIEEATAEHFSVVQDEGGRSVRRKLKHYNLDAIIAVGYRVSSRRATQFRIWATQILKEFIIKGFVLDDERLKQGKQTFGEDYFQELLERTVTGFFDYIENIIENRVQMSMTDMAEAVDKFLSFNEYRLLSGKGQVSRTQALDKARAEYADFNRTQKIESDFDRMVKERLVSEREKK